MPGIAIREDVVWERVGDELVLVDLETNHVFELSDTAARLWELLTNGKSMGDARETLLAEYDVAAEQLDGEIEALTTKLLDEGLAVSGRA